LGEFKEGLSTESEEEEEDDNTGSEDTNFKYFKVESIYLFKLFFKN
jgi:hypothetical protein